MSPPWNWETCITKVLDIIAEARFAWHEFWENLRSLVFVTKSEQTFMPVITRDSFTFAYHFFLRRNRRFCDFQDFVRLS
jgi:hypothetical protein